jgi:arylsulfatase A-like enzyme
MLWNPKMFHGARSRTIGGQVDLNPTIADLLGVPPAASWQGRSLFAPSRPPRAYFYAADHDYMLGVREHEWKYIYDAKRGREYLFDLAHDPVEKVNRAEENPDQCRRLRQRLSAWLQYEEKHLAGLRQAKR